MNRIKSKSGFVPSLAGARDVFRAFGVEDAMNPSPPRSRGETPEQIRAILDAERRLKESVHDVSTSTVAAAFLGLTPTIPLEGPRKEEKH